MRRPLIGREDFETFIKQGEQAQRKVTYGGLPKERIVSCVGERERKRMNV